MLARRPLFCPWGFDVHRQPVSDQVAPVESRIVFLQHAAERGAQRSAGPALGPGIRSGHPLLKVRCSGSAATCLHSPLSVETMVGVTVDVLRQEDADAAREELKREVMRGLMKESGLKSLSSMFFYDDEGSVLFSKITELEDYYLTRCESEVLRQDGEAIIRTLIGSSPGTWKPVNIIELGAGDGRKTRILLETMLRTDVKFEYFAIDISRKAVEVIAERLTECFEGRVKVHGIVADNVQGLNWIKQRFPERNNVLLFLGSSIGNYDMPSAQAFLTKIACTVASGDRLLIGFDLKKDPEVLRRAYSDMHGITASFNRNLLTRINRELASDFEPEAFFHVANFNPVLGAMESWLVSSKDQRVSIPGLGTIFFEEYEPIHTEYSFKYTSRSVQMLAEKSGFKLARSFLHTDDSFVDSVFVKP